MEPAGHHECMHAGLSKCSRTPTRASRSPETSIAAKHTSLHAAFSRVQQGTHERLEKPWDQLAGRLPLRRLESMVRMVREGMALEELPQDAGRGPCRLLLRMASTRSCGNAPGLPQDSGRVPAACRPGESLPDQCCCATEETFRTRLPQASSSHNAHPSQ